MNQHEQYIYFRIKESTFPLRCWYNSKGLCCAGTDFPDGIDWTPVGTYDKNITAEQFAEDLRYAKSSPEPLLEA